MAFTNLCAKVALSFLVTLQEVYNNIQVRGFLVGPNALGPREKNCEKNLFSPRACFTAGVASPGTVTVQSQGLGTQVTQALTRTIVSTPIMATTTAASQEAAAAVEAMEAENAEAIEGLPMQVSACCSGHGIRV